MHIRSLRQIRLKLQKIMAQEGVQEDKRWHRNLTKAQDCNGGRRDYYLITEVVYVVILYVCDYFLR